MDESLKNCPFCGGNAVTTVDGYWRAHCVTCGSLGRFANTEAEAIAAWNRRALASPVSPGVREGIARIIEPNAFAVLDANPDHAGSITVSMSAVPVQLVVYRALAKADLILAALPQEGVGADDPDEAFEIGKRDGREETIAEIDRLTGGDGEYRWSSDPARCADPETMLKGIGDRFAALQPPHTDIEAIKREAYRQGWNDREDDILERAERIVGCSGPDGPSGLGSGGNQETRPVEPSSGGWRPIHDVGDCLPVLVSRPDDREFYTPTTAFLDVAGVWRVYRSEGGMTPLPFEPTHWQPLPPAPADTGRGE